MKKVIYLSVLSIFILILISGDAIAENNRLEVFNYNSSSEMIEIDIEILQFKDNFSQVDKYNQEFINNGLDFVFDLNEMAAKDYESIKDEEWEFRPYNATIRYELQKYDDIISLNFYHYQYTGGAHGLTYKFSYNIDKETGQQLELNDFLARKDLTLKDVNDKIKEDIKANPGDYYSGLDFSGIRKDQDYYLRDSVLVIYFQQYEVAPYAFGFPEIEIKY